MGITGRAVYLSLVIFGVCVQDNCSHAIYGKVEEVSKESVKGVTETKVITGNNNLETDAHSDVSSYKDSIGKEKDIERNPRTSTSFTEFIDGHNNRGGVGSDLDPKIGKDIKRDESEIRVQIHYSAETFKDGFDELGTDKNELETENKQGEYAPIPTTHADAGFNGVIIRINPVKDCDKNTDTVNKETLTEADSENTTLPPLICWKRNCPDCAPQESGFRCFIGRFLTVVVRLGISFVIILLLVAGVAAFQHKAKDKHTKRNIGDNENKTLITHTSKTLHV